MKISKISIKNLLGIKEYEADGKDKELLGGNGVGKTSIIDAIKLALSNRSERDYLIRKGETEGEVLIETDSGLRVKRTIREGKVPIYSVKDAEGHDIPTPETFLRGLFAELQLNPVEFLSMTKEAQNRIVLDMIDFKWDLDWIKAQFGEIVPDVNYQQNILCVLYEIQKDTGYYFTKRHACNVDARNKTAMVETIAKEIPPNYNADYWAKFKLSDIYAKIETIRAKNANIEKARGIVNTRDNKARGISADLQIKINSIEKEASNGRSNLEKEIVSLENRIKECRSIMDSIEKDKDKDIRIAEMNFKNKVAELDAEVKQYQDVAGQEPEDFSELEKEAKNAEDMKAHLNEYNRLIDFQDEVEDLNKKSAEYTAKIEKARTLPGEILEKSEIPVKGLTIKEGIPLVNGLPISNLSEGEKLDLCVDVATHKKEALQILLIDGIERLEEKNREKLYANLKSKGVQFIATRTTNDQDLTVVEI